MKDIFKPYISKPQNAVYRPINEYVSAITRKQALDDLDELKYLIDKAMIVELCNEIKLQIDVLRRVSNFVPYEKLLKQMGFPQNWEEISEIENHVCGDT